MSYRIIAMSALLCLSACTPRPNLPVFPDSVQRIFIYGASVAAPQEKGWYVDGHTSYKVAIIKLGNTKDATVAFEIQDFKLAPPAPGEDFVALVKQQESGDPITDPGRFTEKVHEVTPFKLGDAVCARAHMLSEDKAAKTPTGEVIDMLLEVYTLNCRHPSEPRLGINVSYSLRYYPGDRDPQLDQEAAAVLDSVKLEALQKPAAGPG